MNARETGPVLTGCPSARAVLAAILAENASVEVEDRGAYLRVRARGTCRVSRASIESALGRPFSLERELEPLMPSFRGRFVLSSEEARWE